ncbi:hypothetical protein BJY01DRAFT_224622 [Aspergillus pseudoustus]|uniref:Uncharacterized protein n=1 Tax=Aspergillus pseudoustus TaxID=1810923 RepID=A0ABR4J1X9_9EURO
MACHISVQEFVTKMKTLARTDAVLLNAGIFTQDVVLQEGFESTLNVNVLNTFLLAALLVLVLRRSADTHGILPRLSIVASDRHVMNNLPEWKEKNTFQVLNYPKRAQMGQRYPVSKLLQILLARAMANRLVDMAGKPVIIVNSFTPGYTHSGLMNNTHGVTAWAGPLLAKAVARKTEVGARTLVAAVSMGEESHGKYMNDSEIDDYVVSSVSVQKSANLSRSALSPFVRSEHGAKAQENLWKELWDILESKLPGVSRVFS